MKVSKLRHLLLSQFPFQSDAPHVGLDTSTGNNGLLNRGNTAMDHLDDEVPKYERMVFAQSKGVDFKGADIIYDGPCVGRDQDVEEIDINATTDIAYIANFPDEIDIDGLVVLAVASGVVIIDNGAISATLVTNAPLAKANLQDRFWRHDRYLKRGTMNGEAADLRWHPAQC